MTYQEFQAVFAYLTRYHEEEQSQDWYVPYDRLPDLGLTADADVTRELWEAYEWEIETVDMLPGYDPATGLLPEGVEQTNFASPKPDWSVLVSNVEAARAWQAQQEQEQQEQP